METPKHSKRLWPVILGGFVLIFLFALAVKFLSATTPAAVDEDAARALERTEALEALRVENATKLGTYAWVDKTKGQVQIPIAQAMELAAARLNSRPPAPAGPVNPPAPAPTAPEAEAASGEAQPSASPAAQPAPAN